MVGMDDEAAACICKGEYLPLKFSIDFTPVVGCDNPDVYVAAELYLPAKSLRDARHVHASLDLHSLKTVHAGIDETWN